MKKDGRLRKELCGEDQLGFGDPNLGWTCVSPPARGSLLAGLLQQNLGGRYALFGARIIRRSLVEVKSSAAKEPLEFPILRGNSPSGLALGFHDVPRLLVLGSAAAA